MPATKNEAKRPLVRTISVQVANIVRERIMTGAYADGAPLLQDTIAAEFGVSKIPVREALVQLSAEGLVDIHAHRGFQVRPMSVAEAEEVLGVRLMIEPAVCAEGARLARQEDRVAAEAALEALNRKLSGRKMDGAGQLNLDFHLALTVPRLQPIATEIVSRLLIISQRYAHTHMTAPGRSGRATDEHVAIFRAWSAGRGREVERLVRAHIQAARDDMLAMLREEG